VATSTADAGALGDDFDPMGQFRDSVAGDVRDPYPEVAGKRATMPVERMALGGPGMPDWGFVVYRRDDVEHVLRDHEAFSSASIRDLMSPVMGDYVLVGLDEPEHRRHRALVSPAFRQKMLARWEDEVMLGVTGELIDRFADRGHAELVREYTFHFPVQVIAAILGVPRTQYLEFHRFAVDIINYAADPDQGVASSRRLVELIEPILAERRAEPRDDLISDLVTAELDGERLRDEEIYSFLRLLLPAGAETTYRATGNFLFGLLTHPAQLAAVAADRSLMKQAVEEAIRWEPPLLITARTAAADTELAGAPVPAGSVIVVHTGSANRDEAYWERPDEFDIFRAPGPHLSFGTGVHMCLGMNLARMEMGVAVGALLDRLPDLRLDPDGDDPHIHGQSFRSPTSLPVLWK
jgi:cytochrome P450